MSFGKNHFCIKQKDAENNRSVMKKLLKETYLAFLMMALSISCKIKNQKVSVEDINAINLKRGEVVLCGSSDDKYGSVKFDVSCSGKIKDDFNLGIAFLHSFEYDEAEKVFAKIIDKEPGCAMAYWGVAMCNFHALWTPSAEPELKKGAQAISIARTLGSLSERESDYIEAIALYYTDWDKFDHHARCLKFEEAMEIIYKKFPQDKEAAIFYSLALDASADPTDKSFAKQKKAGAILNAIYPGVPNHPGIVHYIIHTYDYPGLAEMALPAARKYASIAPASAHAQHMPSHIFTRLGLWDESIQSNLNSTSFARCYAESAGIKGHWDEELHAMDYLMYAYLQKGDNILAEEQWNYLKSIHEVYPANFKVAYAFAAIPSRYLLENKMWRDAAVLDIRPVDFSWEKFPWQNAIIHFTRLLGSIHTGNLDSAGVELNKLKLIHEALVKDKDLYKANQVDIQIRTAEAWILFKQGRNDKALDLMNSAADMEDATEKHPVTPGEVLPARELLGDMLLEMHLNSKALVAYQSDLVGHPNRFNGLYGAGSAAEKSGDIVKADYYYRKLSDLCANNSTRPELVTTRVFLKKTGSLSLK
jgi:tetratricopeptide (TPR) repeat protein